MAAVVVFHATLYGAVVSSAPSRLPSRRNCTPPTPTLSAAVAVTSTVPDTVAPAAGDAMDTVGGVTSFEPRETTSATGAPGSSTLPAAGVELITRPAGIVSLNAVVTAPTVKPAPVIAVVAAACVMPTTFGTTRTSAPGATMVPSENCNSSMFRSVSVPSLPVPKPAPAVWTTVTVPFPFKVTA